MGALLAGFAVLTVMLGAHPARAADPAAKQEFGNNPCSGYPTSTCEGLDGGTDGGTEPYKECIETGVFENCV